MALLNNLPDIIIKKIVIPPLCLHEKDWINEAIVYLGILTINEILIIFDFDVGIRRIVFNSNAYKMA